MRPEILIRDTYQHDFDNNANFLDPSQGGKEALTSLDLRKKVKRTLALRKKARVCNHLAL
jgi:hypothetical protein